MNINKPSKPNTTNLLQRLQWTDGITEIWEVKVSHGTLKDYDSIIKVHGKKDLYFVSWQYVNLEGVSFPPNRTKDDDLIGKAYIFADFDIRNYFYKEDESIVSDEKIIEYKDILMKAFDKDALLSSYTAIVFSGNGLHVYRCGEIIKIDKGNYSNAVKYIYKRIEKLFEDRPELKPDYACSNISSLARLPGSYNQKSKFWFPPKEVVVLAYSEKESPLIKELPRLADEYKKQEQAQLNKWIKKLEKTKVTIWKKIDSSLSTELFDEINMQVPIEDLVCGHTGWTLAKDNKNFTGGNNKDSKWAFISKEQNILIRRGTPHISSEYPVYSPFAFTMVHYCSWDVARTFERFKDNYSDINTFYNLQLEKMNKDTKKNQLRDSIQLDLWLEINLEDPRQKQYLNYVNEVLLKSNMLLIPISKAIAESSDEDNVDNYRYTVYLYVQENNFGTWIKNKKIVFDYNGLFDTPEKFKTFLIRQNPAIDIKIKSRAELDQRIKTIRIWLIDGYEKTFGLKNEYLVDRFGFDGDNKQLFVFSNGHLDIEKQSFKKINSYLKQDQSISLIFPEEKVSTLTLEQASVELLWLEHYISNDKSISAIILGYIVWGIFRNEYREKQNEFPFLGIECATGMGKTSLLNLLSRVVGYNWDSIEWVSNTDFASEVGMDQMWWWYYLIDEIQKASTKLLKFVQAAYNSGTSRKWGKDWDWHKLQEYKKDCSLICAGEILPYQDEALVNRFILLSVRESFLVKKQVTNDWELALFNKVFLGIETGEFLTTDNIRAMAIEYYRPRFMKLLQEKNNIDFASYFERAKDLVFKIAGNNRDVRILNNLSLSLTGYIIIHQGKINDEELSTIAEDYLSNFKSYKRNSVVSDQMVRHIIENMNSLSSWIPKVKGAKDNPLVYPLAKIDLDWRITWKSGMIIKLSSLIALMKQELDLTHDNKHLEQQLCSLLNIDKKSARRNMKAIKNSTTMTGVYIPFYQIEKNEYLQRIWDSAVNSIWESLDWLEHILSWEKWLGCGLEEGKRPIYKTMSNEKLETLITEIKRTYSCKDHFDKEMFEEDMIWDPL